MYTFFWILFSLVQMEATFTKLLLLTVLAAGSGIPMEGSQEMPAQSEIDDNEVIGLPDAENGTSNNEGAESSPTDAVDLAEVIHDQQVQLDYLYDLFHSRFTNDQQNSSNPVQTARSKAQMIDQVKTSESNGLFTSHI